MDRKKKNSEIAVSRGADGGPVGGGAASMASYGDDGAQDFMAEEANSSGCWSPSFYPNLRFCWASDDEELSFHVTVALDSSIFVDTVLSEESPYIPFSLRNDTGPQPFIEGALSYDALGSPPILSVRDLNYPGGNVDEQVFYP